VTTTHHNTESENFAYHLAAWVKQYWRDVVPIGVVVVVLLGIFIYLVARGSPTATPKLAMTTSKTSGSGSITVGGGSNTTTTQNSNTSELWNSSVHGLLALEYNGSDNFLVLLNPNNGNVLARVAIPKSGTYNNRKYTAGFALGITNYEILDALNNTHRYVAIAFAPASDGSTDVGYYDLETGKTYDVTPKAIQQSGQTITKDSNPAFESNNPDLLVFTRSTAGTGFTQGEQSSGQSYAYNLITKQVQPYSGTTSGNCRGTLQYAPNSGDCELMGQGPSAGVGFANDGMESLGVDPTPNQSNSNNYADDSQGDTFTPVETTGGGQTNPVDCDPDQWLPNNTMLCDSDDGTNILIVNMSSFKMGSDNFYQVPSSTDLLPTNQRDNGGAIASPDGKTIDFVSNGDLYQVPVKGGQPSDIMNGLDAGDTSTYNGDLTLLLWR
jgi:hypothetical protein